MCSRTVHLKLSSLHLINISNQLVSIRPRSMKHSIHIRSLIRMLPKEISLRLRQICRQTRTSIRIKVIQTSAQCKRGNSIPHQNGNDMSPCGRALVLFPGRHRVNHEIWQIFIPPKGILDFLQDCLPRG